jgi:hypothetical protein
MSAPGDDPDIEEQIQNIGAGVNGASSAVPPPPAKKGKPGPKPRKGKPGPKPRKEKVSDKPQAVRFDDEEEPTQDPLDEGEESNSRAEGDGVEAAFHRRVVLCGQIKAFKARFGMSGTELVPDPTRHSEELLAQELDLLKREVNCKRGSSSIKMLTVSVIAPLLVTITNIVGNAAERRGDPRPVDLQHLPEVIKENWQDLFQDAADQIAIENPRFFEAGPYAAFGQGVLAACAQTDTMNKMRADREKVAKEGLSKE